MLSEKELAILKLLCENARMSVTEISKKVGLPRSTVYEKIKKLEQADVIKRYACTVNFGSLGLPINVKVLFKVPSANKAKFGAELVSSPNTNNVVRLGNDFDYLASFVFDSMDNLHKFLDALAEKYDVNSHQILYVAKDMKREGFLSTSL